MSTKKIEQASKGASRRSFLSFRRKSKPNTKYIEFRTTATNTEDPDCFVKSPEIESSFITVPSNKIFEFKKQSKERLVVTKAKTPKVRLKFYLPMPQLLPPRRTLRNLLNFL